MRMMRRRGKNWGDAKERTPSSNLKISFLSVMHGHHCMDHETGGNESRSVGKGGGVGGRRPTGHDDIPILSPESPRFMQERTFFFLLFFFCVFWGQLQN